MNRCYNSIATTTTKRPIEQEVDWNFLLVFWPLNFPLYFSKFMLYKNVYCLFLSPLLKFNNASVHGAVWKIIMKNSIKSDEIVDTIEQPMLNASAEINDVKPVTLHIDYTAYSNSFDLTFSYFFFHCYHQKLSHVVFSI